MCFLICTLLLSLWCYDDLCLAIKFNVPPDIFTVICCCSVIVDVAAADIKNYLNIYFFKKCFVFFLWCFLLLFIPCLCQPHECDCIQYFSIKVSGEDQSSLSLSLYNFVQYCIFKMVGHDDIAVTSCLLYREDSREHFFLCFCVTTSSLLGCKQVFIKTVNQGQLKVNIAWTFY